MLYSTAPLDQPAQQPAQPSALGSGGPIPACLTSNFAEELGLKDCLDRGTVGGSGHAQL